MKTRILTLIVLGIFLLASIASVSVIADKQNIRAQNSNRTTENGLDQIFSFIEKHKSINSFIKNLIKQQIEYSNQEDFYYDLPGFYLFSPCSSINIEGIGTVSEDDSHLTIYLHDGSVDLNNSYSDIFIEWQICAIIILINFSGEWDGSQEFPFKSLTINGESDYALLVEFSYLLSIDIQNNKYERGKNIPVKLKRFMLIGSPPESVIVTNPHFYVYQFDAEEEEAALVREDILQVTWEITFLISKTWNWDQKDDEGEQVPDGTYGFVGEFEVEGRVHPVIGDGVEIVEKFCRNKGNKFLLPQTLHKFFNSFPVIKNLIRLL